MYSSEEIAGFKAKDLRISKVAILKSLIEKCSEEDVHEVKKIVELAEEYINYVYAERSTKRGSVGCVADSETTVNWVCLAEGLNFAKPNTVNIKILNEVFNEYKQVNKANANPSDILTHIFSRFGKYPNNLSSVKVILESLKNGQ